jgi:hypothetical protein
LSAWSKAAKEAMYSGGQHVYCHQNNCRFTHVRCSQIRVIGGLLEPSLMLESRDVVDMFGLYYIGRRRYVNTANSVRSTIICLKTHVGLGQTLGLRPFRSPQWLLSCTKKHNTMAGIRASGKMLAGGAVCQRMRSSNSSGTFVAATFRRSHLIHADDSHSDTAPLNPISFK